VSAPDPPEEGRTPVTLRYPGTSQVHTVGDEERVALAGDSLRGDVHLAGALLDPLPAREALSTLYRVVGGDYRYTPKDRSAYMAYRQMRQRSSGLSAWRAQQAYFDWLARNDPLAWVILDPVVSVHPDEVSFEVFSKDEGTYARLAIGLEALELDGAPRMGTTNVDFSEALFKGVQHMRSYRTTRLEVGADAVALGTVGEASGVVEKRVQLPDAWLRGFLQVQSASTLDGARFTVAPVDLYNVLRHLRLHADHKNARRGIRVELAPGEPPRLVLEPWEVVIPTTAGPYTGRQARVIRIWGRRRLMALRRMLPFVTSIDVHLLGSGLPGFFVLRAGALTLTLGLSGFTASSWVQRAAFDALLPRRAGATAAREAVVGWLAERWLGGAAAIAAGCGIEASEALRGLQRGCQEGLLMYDVAREVYRYRPLVDGPLDQERLRYRGRREREAHDLLATPEAVRITRVDRIPGGGVEVTAQVTVAADRRDYRVQLLIGDDGRVRRADCTTSFFRRHGLRRGPSAPLMATLMAWRRAEAERTANAARSRETLEVETRVFVQRDDRGEAVYRLTLDRRRLRIQWGRTGAPLRGQSLVFNTTASARADYFSRVDRLTARGFIDATAAG